MKKRILSVLTALALVLTLIPPAAMAAESGPGPDSKSTEEPEDYRTFEFITSAPDDDAGLMPFGLRDDNAQAVKTYPTDGKFFGNQLEEKTKAIYTALETFFANSENAKTDQVTFSTTVADGTTSDDAFAMLVDALAAYDRDHSEVFWISVGGMGMKGTKLTATLSTADSWQSSGGRTIATDQASVTAKVNALATEARKSSDRYNQLKCVHDWLVNNNQYGKANNKTLSYQWEAIGALDTSIDPVCEGYSRAFKLVCDQLNIPCVLVSGQADGGDHMWNYVQMEDGNWYLVDVTWDDPENETSPGTPILRWDYFLIGSSNENLKNRTANTNFIGTTEEVDGKNVTTYNSAFLYPELSTNNYTYTPALAGTVTITGTAKYGETLTADTTGVTDPDTSDGYGISSLKYQWYRAGTAIESATANTYQIKKKDIGKTLTVAVYTDNYNPVTSAPTAAVAKAAPTLTVSKTNVAVKVGGTETFTVTLTGVAGDTLTPVAVTSDKTSIATVTESSGTYTVTGVADGTANITVSYTDATGCYENASKTVLVTVTNRTITGITVKTMPTKKTYIFGETFDPAGLVITVTYDAGDPEEIAYNTAAPNMTFSPTDFTSTGNLTITGTYSGTTFTVPITASAKPLSGASVTVNGGPFPYTVSALTPDVTVTVDGKTLTKDTDYTVAYTNNTAAGDATVTVTGKGNYTGTASATFTIEKADPAVGTVSLGSGVVVYETTAPGLVTLTHDGTATGTLGLTAPASFTGQGGKTVACTWTFTPTDAANYKTVTGTISIPVTARAVDSIAVGPQPTKTSYVYGEPFDPAGLALTVTYNNSDTETVTWSEGCGMTFDMTDLGDVGTKDVTVTYGGKTAAIPVTVTAKILTIPTGVEWDVSGSPFTYDGSVKSVTLKNEDQIPAELTVTKTGNTATDAGSYTATAAFALKSCLTAGNYDVTSISNKTGSWSIDKADLTGKDASISIKYDDTAEKTVAASAFGITQAGTFALKSGGAITGTGLASTHPTYGSEVKIQLAGNLDTTAVGTIIIPVTFTPNDTNYNPIDLTLTVNVTDKNVTEVTADPFTKTYDGKAVTLEDITKSASVAGSWTTADTLPTNAGAYSCTLTFTPDDTAYTTESEVVTITINKAAVTVTGITQTIMVGEDIPSPLYTTEGLVDGDTLSITPTCTAAKSSPAGEYPITFDGQPTESGNYKITYVPGKLTIKAPVVETVAAPVPNPPSGTTFTDSLTVYLTSETEGAAIYYTTDGTTPSNSSTKYTAPIPITDTTTIKAIAVKGGVSSTEMTATYTKTEPTPPVVDPDPVEPEPTPVPVTGVSLNANALYLDVGNTAQLTATVVPEDADNREVTWTSSVPSVASVSGGLVTALQPGTTVVTVTTVDGEFVATCTVSASYPYVPPVTPSEPDDVPDDTPSTPGSGSNNNNTNNNNSSNNNNSNNNNNNNNTPSTPAAPSVEPETTVSNGTASAEVSADQAAQLVDQAVSSGSSTVVIAPAVTDSTVTRTEVSIPAAAVDGIVSGSSADLKVETPAANITISNSGLSDLGGQDVVVAAEKVGDTVSVEITAGGQSVSKVSGGLKAEIPAKCGPGTIAKVVDENGNVISTVRKSFASAGGDTMNVPLDGSAKLVFVDNSKSFADVPADNWAASAVAFASGHEIMNGVGNDSFSPTEPMTRGMLAVVLHNLEGNPSASYSGRFGDVSDSAWYAEAIQWASDNSIIGGVGGGAFAPDASITREQLVVMLYRYAGQPSVSGILNGFSDVDSVSSWAQQAMAWAVSSGIVGGSNGALNPQSGATRAEVAQMLMNFVSSGVI